MSTQVITEVTFTVPDNATILGVYVNDGFVYFFHAAKHYTLCGKSKYRDYQFQMEFEEREHAEHWLQVAGARRVNTASYERY